MVAYLLLAGAILLEVIATISLRMSEGFTKVIPTIVMAAGYLGAFACLGLGLSRGLSMGVAYGIWAGAGTALVAILGIFLFNEKLNVWGFIGLALIVVGVVLLEMGNESAHVAS